MTPGLVSIGIRPFHWIASDTDILQQLRLVPGITKPSIHNPSCRSKRMRLGFTGIDDVNDFNTMCLQIIGNQTAMASPPYHFGAHDCGGAMAVCTFSATVQFHWRIPLFPCGRRNREMIRCAKRCYASPSMPFAALLVPGNVRNQSRPVLEISPALLC